MRQSLGSVEEDFGDRKGELENLANDVLDKPDNDEASESTDNVVTLADYRKETQARIARVVQDTNELPGGDLLQFPNTEVNLEEPEDRFELASSLREGSENVQEVRDNIKHAASKVYELHGNSIWDAEVTDELPSDVAGRYHPNDKMELSDVSIPSEHLLHIATHEDRHRVNNQKAREKGNGGIENVDLDEGLTEKGTAGELGKKTIAYLHLMGEAKRIASTATKIEKKPVSEQDIINKHHEGENDELNRLDEAAQNPEKLAELIELRRQEKEEEGGNQPEHQLRRAA